MLNSYTRAYGMAAVSLRYFNAAGATDKFGEAHDPETHLIPNVLRAVMRGEPITIFGDDYPTPDGTCIRDYIHVDDLAAGHLAALEFTAGAENGHSSFNLGSGSGFSNLQIVDAAQKVVGRPIERRVGPRRAGDPPILVASNSRAQEVLGWQPLHGSLEEIIGSAWQWRRAHPDGYGTGRLTAMTAEAPPDPVRPARVAAAAVDRRSGVGTSTTRSPSRSGTATACSSSFGSRRAQDEWGSVEVIDEEGAMAPGMAPRAFDQLRRSILATEAVIDGIVTDQTSSPA